MKDVAIWILILAGPILAFLAMRRHHMRWSAPLVALALAVMVVAFTVGLIVLSK